MAFLTGLILSLAGVSTLSLLSLTISESVNVVINESGNIVIAKGLDSAENIKQEIVRVSTLTLLRVPIADLVVTSVLNLDPDSIRNYSGK